MKRVLPLLYFCFVLAFPGFAAADAWKHHIDIASRQSMLAHRAVRALCYAHAGIDTATNTAILTQTMVQMDRALNTLLEGDPAAGIPAIKDGNMRTQLSSLGMVLKGVHKKVDPFLAGETLKDKDVLKLTFKADSLTKLWNNLFYSLELKITVNSSAQDREMAKMQKLAGGQSFLLQKAGKDACLIYVAGGAEKAERQVKSLAEAVSLFHLNAFGLTFGHQAAEIAAPPNAEIQALNANTWQDWIGLETYFDSAAQGEITPASLRALSQGVEYLDSALSDAASAYASL